MTFPYEPTPADTAYITGTALSAATKNATIRDGQLTTMLSGVAYEANNLANGESPTLQAAGRVIWQRWDTATMTYPTKLCDWDTDQDSLIYDDEQLTIGFTPAYLAGAYCTGMADHLSRNNKTVTCYYQTVRSALLTAAENAGSPNVHATRRYWFWGTSDLPSPANGDADELGIKAVIMEMATIIGLGYPVSGLMLDSEQWAAMLDEGAGGVFQELATLLSQTNPVALNPPSSGSPYTAIKANDDGTLLDYRWHYERRNWAYRHKLVRQIIRSLWSEFPVYTDTIDDHYGKFEGLDRVSQWTILEWGTSLPIDTLVEAQKAQAHKRLTAPSAQVWVGPHLGRLDLAHGGTTYPTPNSPHAVATGMGGAIAGGATGFSLWGHGMVYSGVGTYYTRSYDGDTVASGQWVMETLKRFRALTDRQAALITSWAPTASRMAILYSQTDYQYESGRGSNTNTLCSTSGEIPETVPRSWQAMRAGRNLHRAAILTGEPLEVVTTEDLEETGLAAYDVLLVPSAYVLTQAEYDAIDAFKTGGGTVIAHVGSCLTPLSPTLLDGTYHAYWTGAELAPPYNAYTAMTCKAMWQFLRALAADLVSLLPWAPRFTPRYYGAAVTEMTAAGRRYAVIVPMRFRPGDVDAWWVSVSGKSKFCDRGLISHVRVNEASQDIESGRSYTAAQWITVGPGQIKIVELLG
jgi:hypothetical protein